MVSTFNKPKDPKVPPPPPMPAYAPFNFIVDTTGSIYYYQFQLGKSTGEDGINDVLTPLFINLQPEGIVQVPQAILQEFIKSNILSLDKDYRFVSVASPVDTVTTPSFESLMDILSDTTSHVKYSIRKITQEEEVVLDHKKRQIYYDPSSIKWDSTRIWFPSRFKTPKFETAE
ncbi:MAG TPA: hypothetical protein VNS32_21060 [Flavisolibacter sp.]|nr:hypothetical protein [Flavisolibacter sp.]